MATLVKALQAVSVQGGPSIAAGAVASVADALATSLISAGLCEAVTEITPTGKITITENGENINIAQYATADVAVEGSGFEVGVLHVTANVPQGATNIQAYYVGDSGEGYLKEFNIDNIPSATFDVYCGEKALVDDGQDSFDAYYFALGISYELDSTEYAIDYENSIVTGGFYSAGAGSIVLNDGVAEGSISVVFAEDK